MKQPTPQEQSVDEGIAILRGRSEAQLEIVDSACSVSKITEYFLSGTTLEHRNIQARLKWKGRVVRRPLDELISNCHRVNIPKWRAEHDTKEVENRMSDKVDRHHGGSCAESPRYSIPCD